MPYNRGRPMTTLGSMHPVSRARDARRTHLSLVLSQRPGLLFIILLFVALVGTHLDVIPIWDAKNYLYCVEDPLSREA